MKLSHAADEYQFPCCALLTGTPLQNNLQELFALLQFAAPSVFTSVDDFNAVAGIFIVSDAACLSLFLDVASVAAVGFQLLILCAFLVIFILFHFLVSLFLFAYDLSLAAEAQEPADGVAAVYAASLEGGRTDQDACYCKLFCTQVRVTLVLSFCLPCVCLLLSLQRS